MGLAGFGAAEPRDPGIEFERLAAGAFCVCGCGNHLPGSSHAPVCFGCSVGKADLAFIREALAAGRTPEQILLELADPILVEVFADYDDERLPAIWERARRVTGELGHHRVVLRSDIQPHPELRPLCPRKQTLLVASLRGRGFKSCRSDYFSHKKKAGFSPGLSLCS